VKSPPGKNKLNRSCLRCKYHIHRQTFSAPLAMQMQMTVCMLKWILYMSTYPSFGTSTTSFSQIEQYLGIRNAGNIHQPAAVKAEGSHVLQQQEGIHRIDGCYQGLHGNC